MFIGPAFTREAHVTARRGRHYLGRTAYVAALLILMCTLWMVLTGTQEVRSVGDFARFGAMLFQFLAPLQLAIVVFFSALFTASAVAAEKDRRTLVLLLMTRLTNSELVLGKLCGSLLHVVTLILAGLPVFMVTLLFGGVSPQQIASVFGVTLASALAAGSLGSTVALWREKTFQALALTALLLVFWVGLWEVVAALDKSWLGVPAETWAVWFSPWRAVREAARPQTQPGQSPALIFLATCTGLAALLNLIAIWRVRTWNTVLDSGPRVEEEPAATSQESGGALERAFHEKKKHSRPVWNSPVIWREICTWAYGRKVLLIRIVYVLLWAVSFGVLVYRHEHPELGGVTMAGAAWCLLPIVLLSLAMINALAVVSITNERDSKALDLLLVTDVTPREFVFGKLGGVFYNTKEMILLPLLPCLYLWQQGLIRGEDLWFLVLGLLVLDVFVAMLGLHVGMAYVSSRSAIGVSLGTVFFLTLGIATCMRIMVAFGGQFQVQLAPFVTFILGGSIGLYVAIGIRNPSTAIFLAALFCPFATFYAITSFLLQNTLAVFLVVVATYGFTTLAMLIPAIYSFDVATGRTAGADE